MIAELRRRAREKAVFKQIDGKTALAVAAAKAGALGARYVLLLDEYVELYDVEKGEMRWWNNEEEFLAEWGERLRDAEVLYAVGDRHGLAAFVLAIQSCF
ncbi:hypothetical protein [Thermofilum sp.]|uniref:hypothetical protein n=1 Tax=Thermofilum sp. TaxID=1961369 RepID=UPI0031792706